MLIVSKHRDYYDTAIVYGVDKTIVYERTQASSDYNYAKTHGRTWYRETDIMHPDLNVQHKWNRMKCFKRVECSVIAFCGKLYPVYIFTYENDDIEYSYDKDTTIDILTKEGLYEKTKNNSFWGRNFYSSSYIDNFYNVDNWSYLLKHFQEFKQPVFMLKKTRVHGRNYEIEIAPTLADYKFAKVFPPTQAFQEIQNYISGVLGTGERDMVILDDSMKAQKKGYDKWSFRTHKADSKKPRKKK